MSQLINAEASVSSRDRLLDRLSEITGLSPKELTRFLKFAIVGAIGMVVDLTVLNLLQ